MHYKANMEDSYRILLVEDVPADAELAQREIKKAFPKSTFFRVDTRLDFIKALDDFNPDIIVSDYSMPTFDGLNALKITLDKAPLIPFVVFTGSMNEDIAVECMKAGATDYVIKEDIKRIVPAIKRALEIKSIKEINSQTQKALIESEARFRRLAENANDLIYRYEFLPQRCFSYVSPSATQITGFSPEEHYGDPDLGFKLIHPEDKEILEKIFSDKDAFKKPFVLRWIKKNGEVIWTEQVNVPLFDEQGNLIAIEGIARDITQRKQAEEQLKESESRFRQLLDSIMNISVQGYDANGIIHYWNYASERIYGYTKAEALGKNILDLIIPEEIKPVTKKHIETMALIKEGLPAEELLLMRKDGERVPVFSNHVVICPPNKEVELYCIDVDLTERDKAVEEVKLNEARLRSLVAILQNSAKSTEGLLEFALNEAIKITDSEIGYIFTYDENEKRFEVNAFSQTVMENCKVADPKSCYELNETGIWGEAVRQRKPIMINDFVTENPLKKGYPEGHIKITRFLSLPIIVDTKIVAVIGVANKKSDYQETDILQLTLLMNSFWQILEQNRTELEIRFLSTATEQSPLSVIITDTSGKIQFVNQKFVNSTSYSKEELKGRTLRIFRPDFIGGEKENLFFKHLNEGKAWKGELKNIKDSGNEYWEEVYVSPILNKEGIVSNFLVLSEDISIRKQMEIDLIKAKDMAEENDRLKTAFLNNLSHEIRTPLNAVVGYAQLLDVDNTDNNKLKKYAEVIQQGSQQLLSIMDNIITIAVIEAGQIKINKAEANLNKVLNIVYNQLKEKAENKKISLKSSALFSRYEADVIIDETKVVQVLTNLVDNAIKHTFTGYVQFGCSIHEKELIFFVEDTGVGIPDDQKELVFERFRQGKNENGKIQEGMGLGLSISKSYIELMGGRIWVESEVGKGSKFSFAVPFKSVLGESSSKSNNDELLLDKTKTILVVDDVEINYQLISAMVSDFNVSVIYASSGKEAISLVSNNKDVDIVLMDVKMPGMDGYTATKELKKIRSNLPVIAQTAYAIAGDRQKSIENGCDDYISKPISRSALISLLKKFLVP